MKKLISMLVVVALVLGLCVTAFAYEAPANISSLALVGSGIPGVGEWNPADPAGDMELVADYVYEKTLSVTAGNTMKFKVAGNDAWDDTCNFGSASIALGVVADLECGGGSGDMPFTPEKDMDIKITVDLTDYVNGGNATILVEEVVEETPEVPSDANVIAEGTATFADESTAFAGKVVSFTAAADGTVSVEIVSCDPGYYVDVYNDTIGEWYCDFANSTAETVSFDVVAGNDYTVIISSYTYYGPTLKFASAGSVTYKISGGASSEVGGDDPDVVPGSDENNAIVFTDASYTATVPANSTVWFAFDDYEDYYFNAVYNQQFTVSGATGYTVSYAAGTMIVDDTDGAVAGEAYCNMNGQYIFSITNNTDSEQNYVVAFSNVGSEEEGEVLVDVSGETVTATAPWTFTFSIDTPGILNVKIGDCAPGWRYKIYGPSSESIYQTKWTAGEDANHELAEVGEYRIELFAYSAAEADNVSGTVSATVTFTPNEIEIEKEEYIVSDVKLQIGDNDLTMDPNAITTIFEFVPTENGTYIFTADDGSALVGYWGAGSFFMWDQTENKSNILEVIVTEGFEQEIIESSTGEVVGVEWSTPSIMVGISGVESVILNVEKAEDYIPPVEVEWDYYENTELEYWFGTEGEIIPIDVTDDVEDLVFFGPDGLFRYGSPTGPVIVADLTNGLINFMEAIGYGTMRVAYTDENGEIYYKIDFNDAISEYYYACQQATVPLTSELAYMLAEIGNSKGWYDPEVLGFYLFEDAVVDPAYALLAFCGYIEGSEITPDNLGTVFAGSNTFETEEDAYVGDYVTIYASEDGVVTVELLSSDPGYCIYLTGYDAEGCYIEFENEYYEGDGSILFTFDVEAGSVYYVNLCSAEYDEESDWYWEVPGSISYVVTYDVEAADPYEPETPVDPETPDEPETPETPDEPETPETPVKPGTPDEDIPKTGDMSIAAAVVALMAATAGAIVITKKKEF